MGVRTFAAIDVGSYELTMKIFEFSGKNNMREIDCIGRRLDLGSDTFARGKIGKEKMDGWAAFSRFSVSAGESA